MKSPLCPNCRESMSSVEIGTGGVWSCLYCEGNWLTAEKLNSLASTNQSTDKLLTSNTFSLNVTGHSQTLVCPSCETTSFEEVNVGTVTIHRCQDCGGSFFKKGILAALAPNAFSAEHEAPIVAALSGAIGTVALLGDPLILLAALASKPKS